MIVAIDPGPSESAIVQWDGANVQEATMLTNELCRTFLQGISKPFTLAVEMIACYGMPVGAETFETCLHIGRIQQIAEARQVECHLVYRREVKMHLCHSMKAKDSNIRQALIDKFGPPGTKKNRGRLYGVSSHMWAALAVAVCFEELSGQKQRECRVLEITSEKP